MVKYCTKIARVIDNLAVQFNLSSSAHPDALLCGTWLYTFDILCNKKKTAILHQRRVRIILAIWVDINVDVNLVITEVLSLLVLLLAVILAICLARHMADALILMSVRVVILIVSSGRKFGRHVGAQPFWMKHSKNIALFYLRFRDQRLDFIGVSQ